ncbi:MAG: hypothetical protein HGA96_05560 [Desulfobulbaceae bacterium]|nr:hypothetical protein [Desulfobulbaceae bacterium]
MSLPARLLQYLLSFRWGASSLAALYVSILSGVILAWQFDASEPYYSCGSLELVVPCGSFWRASHFYSSQAFFLLLVGHFVVVLFDRRAKALALIGAAVWVLPSGVSGENWGRLYLTLPVSLLLLFSGYVLRGDATGYSAGMIGENITLALPLAGDLLNHLLFNISRVGMRVVYANHLIGLVILAGGLAWPHLRRYRIRITDYGWLVAAMLGLPLLVPAPFDPFRVGDFHISGPWFFVGVQELLRYLQPFWGGIVFPAIAVGLGYQALIDPIGHRSLLGLAIWGVVYLALTLLGLF